MICRCGHPRADHYEYIVFDGHDQTRCRSCDPHTGKRQPGNYAMAADSYESAMYHAADHDFYAAETPEPEGGTE